MDSVPDSVPESSDRPRPTRAADRLLSSAARRGGVITRDQIDLEGHASRIVHDLVADGRLIRVGRGVYRLAEYAPFGEAALVVACAIVPRGVVTLVSALAQYKLTTQIPASVFLAVPSRTNDLSGTPEVRIALVRVAPRFLRTDVQAVTADSGGRYRIFAKERAVCEAFRFRRIVGEDVAYEALGNLLRGPFDRARLVRAAALTGTGNFVLPPVKALLP
ncbi:MAG: putative transcriptional regulator [Candidatus Eremiobacteraeota bacterium]|nr:putative transcriptional regulator [Candidatus Eremiobacteraeota bacterium]